MIHDTMNQSAWLDGAICLERAPIDRPPIAGLPGSGSTRVPEDRVRWIAERLVAGHNLVKRWTSPEGGS